MECPSMIIWPTTPCPLLQCCPSGPYFRETMNLENVDISKTGTQTVWKACLELERLAGTWGGSGIHHLDTGNIAWNNDLDILQSWPTVIAQPYVTGNLIHHNLSRRPTQQTSYSLWQWPVPSLHEPKPEVNHNNNNNNMIHVMSTYQVLTDKARSGQDV